MLTELFFAALRRTPSIHGASTGPHVYVRALAGEKTREVSFPVSGSPLPAGEALTDHARIFVDQYTHVSE
jgi:hypothetical protein